MKVRDVMTTDVVTVRPNAPIGRVVDDLIRYGISGVPVIDEERRVVGIVTEADVVAKEAYGPRHRALGILARLLHDRENRWVAKAEGLTAGDVMTALPFTAAPDDDLRRTAARMVTLSVKRLPVVDESDRLVGIVSRRDVLRMFHRSDEELLLSVRRVLEDRWRLPEDRDVTAAVADGVVTLSGTVRYPLDIRIIEAAVADVPGLLDVQSNLVAREANPSAFAS